MRQIALLLMITLQGYAYVCPPVDCTGNALMKYTKAEYEIKKTFEELIKRYDKQVVLANSFSEHMSLASTLVQNSLKIEVIRYHLLKRIQGAQQKHEELVSLESALDIQIAELKQNQKKENK